MISHGISHVGASLVSLLASHLLVDEVAIYIPQAKDWIRHAATSTLNSLGLVINDTEMTRLLVIVVITFVWGVAFKLSNR